MALLRAMSLGHSTPPMRVNIYIYMLCFTVFPILLPNCLSYSYAGITKKPMYTLKHYLKISYVTSDMLENSFGNCVSLLSRT